MKKILFFLTIILLISIMLISSYFIYKESKQNQKQEEVFEELVKITENSDQNEQNDKKSTEDTINLKELYEINNDLIGWIKIENTDLSYPVVKSKIKNYYLRKDFYKKYSSYGTPFLAEGCDIDTSDNVIIYGHHINNQKMFGYLENYKKEEYYRNHKIIDFYTLNESETIKNEYEIFAVFKTSLYSSNSFKYYSYINFSNKDEFYYFMEKVKKISMYKTNITPRYGEKLITLSTCEYSNKNGRLVVMARKISN